MENLDIQLAENMNDHIAVTIIYRYITQPLYESHFCSGGWKRDLLCSLTKLNS